jgi:hypothetical protein
MVTPCDFFQVVTECSFRNSGCHDNVTPTSVCWLAYSSSGSYDWSPPCHTQFPCVSAYCVIVSECPYIHCFIQTLVPWYMRSVLSTYCWPQNLYEATFHPHISEPLKLLTAFLFWVQNCFFGGNYLSNFLRSSAMSQREGKEDGRGRESKTPCALSLPLSSRTSAGWPLTCVSVTVNEARRYLVTRILILPSKTPQTKTTVRASGEFWCKISWKTSLNT